jgi:hypothetical protein
MIKTDKTVYPLTTCLFEGLPVPLNAGSYFDILCTLPRVHTSLKNLDTFKNSAKQRLVPFVG